MSYTERRELYTAIEDRRHRPLICYVTSSRQGADGSIAYDVIPELATQIQKIPRENEEVDVLIVSDGGDPTVSWRFISMLRERFKKIGVLLPFAAYSAATLLALGADEILMHPFSNMGPVDPQLHYIRRQGMQEEVVHFGSEDLRYYFDFIRKDVGISDQEQLQKSFDLVAHDIGSIPIGVAKRFSHLSLSLGEKLLRLHMKDDNKVKTIAEALNTSFFHHGYAVGRKEGKSIGLPVVEPPVEVEDLMWQVWVDFEQDMECKIPFNPMAIVFQDPDNAAKFQPVSPSQKPDGNAPETPQPDQQNPAQNNAMMILNPVDYTIYQATLESIRCKSDYRTHGKIFSARSPDMNINYYILPLRQSWENYQSPAE